MFTKDMKIKIILSPRAFLGSIETLRGRKTVNTETNIITQALADFKVLSLLLKVQAVDDIYLGRVETQADRWRGGLGEALRQLSCVHTWNETDCVICSDKSKCFYFLFFAADMPHPYIIRQDISTGELVAKGRTFSLNILLLGYATVEADKILKTIHHLGRIGIGAKRGRFELHSAHTKTIKLSEFFNNDYEGDRLTLEFITPLKIKDEEKGLYYSKLPFDVFFKMLIKRIINLTNIYGTAKPLDKSSIEQDKRMLLQSALAIQAEHDCRWVDFTRHSSRQGLQHKIGGVLGEIIFKGDLKVFYPYLKIGEVIHAGLHTTSGFGRYRII